MLSLNYLYENITTNRFSIIKSSFKQVKIQLNDIPDLPQDKSSFEYYVVEETVNKKYIGIGIIDTDPPERMYNIELIFFYINEKYRHQHLGFKLLHHIISKYDDMYIGLQTDSQSVNDAKRLYTTCGFKIIKDKFPFQWWLRIPNRKY